MDVKIILSVTMFVVTVINIIAGYIFTTKYRITKAIDKQKESKKVKIKPYQDPKSWVPFILLDTID